MLSRTPEHLSPRDETNLICFGRPTHQPIKLSLANYLATFAHFRSRTRIVGKGNLFEFATIFTRITARSGTENRLQVACVKELSSGLVFFCNYEQRNGYRFRKTGSVPLIGSNVIQDRASDEPMWSERGSSDPRSDTKWDASCTQSEADRTPNHLYQYREAFDWLWH